MFGVQSVVLYDSTKLLKSAIARSLAVNFVSAVVYEQPPPKYEANCSFDIEPYFMNYRESLKDECLGFVADPSPSISMSRH